MKEETFKLDTSLPIEDVVKLPSGIIDEEQPFQFLGTPEAGERLGTMQYPFGTSALEAASVTEQLKSIYKRYPNVFKRFIDNHYGK